MRLRCTRRWYQSERQLRRTRWARAQRRSKRRRRGSRRGRPTRPARREKNDDRIRDLGTLDKDVLAANREAGEKPLRKAIAKVGRRLDKYKGRVNLKASDEFQGFCGGADAPRGAPQGARAPRSAAVSELGLSSLHPGKRSHARAGRLHATALLCPTPHACSLEHVRARSIVAVSNV